MALVIAAVVYLEWLFVQAAFVAPGIAAAWLAHRLLWRVPSTMARQAACALVVVAITAWIGYRTGYATQSWSERIRVGGLFSALLVWLPCGLFVESRRARWQAATAAATPSQRLPAAGATLAVVGGVAAVYLVVALALLQLITGSPLSTLRLPS